MFMVQLIDGNIPWRENNPISIVYNNFKSFTPLDVCKQVSSLRIKAFKYFSKSNETRSYKPSLLINNISMKEYCESSECPSGLSLPQQ